jgi:hypothetical protein
MERNEHQAKINRYLWIACPVLFLYFAVRLWLAAQGKEFWMDETDTIYFNMKRGIWLLISAGADDGQASRTPLFYLIERLWLYVWGGHPQQYWDFRFFFRIWPVAAWSAANVYLFAHLWRYFSAERGLRLSFGALFAFAIAQFSYSNNFGCYYAIESRPYALWAGFSIVHFLAGWRLVRTRNRGWIPYFVSSLGLVLTTYAALIQICIATGWLVLDEWRAERRIIFFSARMKKIIFTFLGSFAAGVYYFAGRADMGFPSAPLGLFFTSVVEVLLKSFHHHSYHAAFFTVPLLFVVIPLYWRKRSLDLAYASLHGILVFLSTYPLYWVATKKGALFASRYVIYIMPSLTFLYVLGVVTILVACARWLERKSGKPVFWNVLIVLAFAEVITRAASLYKGIPADAARLSARHTFARNDQPACLSTDLPHFPSEFEQLSNECRGIREPLPKNPFVPH